MLDFIREILERYCWENYTVLEFFIMLLIEIIALVLVLVILILTIKEYWRSIPQFEDYEDFEPEEETDDFMFDVSAYEDFDIFTPLHQQEKP